MSNLSRINGDPTRPASRLPGTEPLALDGVYFQRGATPAPDDFTLIGQVAADRMRRLARTLGTPGFATIEPISVANSDLTLPICSALIGDEPVRVCAGTDGLDDNIVHFPSPPGSGTRWDVLILESWVSEVGPLGSSDPSSKSLYLAGGVGNITLAGDPRFVLRNPAISRETTRRTEVRWRLRVAQGVNLGSFPSGLGDPSINGQADAGAPVASHPFQEVPGRTAIYRAGDGGAADALAFVNATGYSWALPIVAILRTSGESAITLTGSVELRKSIVSRVGVAMGQPITVLPRGAYTVGAGASGETAVWKQPHLGGANSGFYPANLPGSLTSDAFLAGSFLVPADDFDLPPGWHLEGKLHGVVFRQEASTDQGSHSYGIRLRRPGQTYGSSLIELTYTLGSVTNSIGDYKRLETVGDWFTVPSDGSADGMWVVELYTDQAGPGNWITSGVQLRLRGTSA